MSLANSDSQSYSSSPRASEAPRHLSSTAVVNHEGYASSVSSMEQPINSLYVCIPYGFVQSPQTVTTLPPKALTSFGSCVKQPPDEPDAVIIDDFVNTVLYLIWLNFDGSRGSSPHSKWCWSVCSWPLEAGLSTGVLSDGWRSMTSRPVSRTETPTPRRNVCTRKRLLYTWTSAEKNVLDESRYFSRSMY